MNYSFMSEDDLKSLIVKLLQSSVADYSMNLLRDESAMFQIASHLSDADSSQLTVRLSFCAVVLLIAAWKQKACDWDLHQCLYNYFTVVNGFVCFSSTKEDNEQVFKKYAENLEDQSRCLENLLLFVPNKFLRDKRLYRIQRTDLERIVGTEAWSKLPHPHYCKSWIKLPPHYERLKRSQVLTRKFSQELLAGVNHTEVTVAKKLIVRNQKQTRKCSIMTDECPSPKTSKFKLMSESAQEIKERSNSILTPVMLSEFDFENSPTLKRIDPAKEYKRTLTRKTTKINTFLSPELKKAASAQDNSTYGSPLDEIPKTPTSSGALPFNSSRPSSKTTKYILPIAIKKQFSAISN